MWQWTYTRYSQVADEEQKKKRSQAYISENFTRYFWVADEKRSQGMVTFLNFLKGYFEKWVLETRDYTKDNKIYNFSSITNVKKLKLKKIQFFSKIYSFLGNPSVFIILKKIPKG